MFLFLFIILLIPFWAEAALLVAEETKAGEAVCIAEITSMCSLGSDVIAALFLCARL